LGRPLFALLLCVAPLGAQSMATPIRFGVAWTGGTPHGDLATISQPPQGFTAQLSLPLARNTAIGIRAEFSVLTFPERILLVAPQGEDQEATVSARGTIGFTGAGPRFEARLGPAVISGGLMAGFVRVITDASARSEQDDETLSATISLSDFAFAGKAALDVYVPVYHGPYGTAVGFVAGADWTTGGQVAFPDLRTFRIASQSELTLQLPKVPPNVSTLRLGIAVEL
jgi:hypothetical protein